MNMIDLYKLVQFFLFGNFFLSYLTFIIPCISVSDLLDYITPDADLKAREAQKKARAKVTELFLFNLYLTILCLLSFTCTLWL